jgi:hypothetical protein
METLYSGQPLDHQDKSTEFEVHDESKANRRDPTQALNEADGVQLLY